MYIKYDESELFEFFECEPVPVGDDDAGDLIFTYSDNEFKLILFLSTYEMYVNILLKSFFIQRLPQFEDSSLV